MSIEPIIKTLVLIGFLQIDAEIYLHLATKGPQSASVIAASLKIPKYRVYRSLKHLVQNQIVDSFKEYPARFSASPLEDVLNRFQKFSLEDAERIEKKKKDMFEAWRSITTQEE
jgi:sugar-specific transcriptional regulator TrmB